MVLLILGQGGRGVQDAGVSQSVRQTTSDKACFGLAARHFQRQAVSSVFGLVLCHVVSEFGVVRGLPGDLVTRNQPRGPCDRKNSIPIENFNPGLKFSSSIDNFNLDR